MNMAQRAYINNLYPDYGCYGDANLLQISAPEGQNVNMAFVNSLINIMRLGYQEMFNALPEYHGTWVDNAWAVLGLSAGIAFALGCVIICCTIVLVNNANHPHNEGREWNPYKLFRRIRRTVSNRNDDHAAAVDGMDLTNSAGLEERRRESTPLLS